MKNHDETLMKRIRPLMEHDTNTLFPVDQLLEARPEYRIRYTGEAVRIFKEIFFKTLRALLP